MQAEFTTKDVVANVKKAWTEMTGKKEEDIQDIKVYVKTEENKAYYANRLGETEDIVELCNFPMNSFPGSVCCVPEAFLFQGRIERSGVVWGRCRNGASGSAAGDL